MESFPRAGSDGPGGPAPLPDSLAELASRAEAALGPTSPAGSIVRACLTNTWTTAMSRSEVDGDPDRPEVFVATGDIPAMWLRDSTAQVRPYLAAAGDPIVGDAIAGVLRRQVRYVLLDPYANAFNDGPTGAHGEPDDLPAPGPWLWERKYEVDSLCAPLQLAVALWRATGRVDHLDADFRAAARRIVELWRREQAHAGSDYEFIRPHGAFSHDTLPDRGRGAPVGLTGMTWSGFRPSDDRCEHGYLVPSNALASSSLHGLAELADDVLGDPELARAARGLADDIDAGILAHAVVESGGDRVLAYEVDGLGRALIGDDANLPSLLSLPLSGWIAPDDELYRRTRALLLSDANPSYFSGSSASGIGSDHTPDRHVWPLAIATAGLTGTEQEASDALELLATTTAGTGLMHESFHVDDPSVFTRPWFGWANSMYAELALTFAGVSVADLFPRNPRSADRVL